MAFCNVDTKTKNTHRYMYTQTNLTNLYIVYHVFVLLTALQFVYDKAQIQRVLVHDIEWCMHVSIFLLALLRQLPPQPPHSHLKSNPQQWGGHRRRPTRCCGGGFWPRVWMGVCGSGGSWRMEACINTCKCIVVVVVAVVVGCRAIIPADCCAHSQKQKQRNCGPPPDTC